MFFPDHGGTSDAEMFVANIGISSKNRITISILLMKFNLYGLVIAWIQGEPAKMHLGVVMCVRVNDGDLGTVSVS